MAEAACIALFVIVLTVKVSRLFIAALILCVFTSHLVISDYINFLDGFSYYASAALFDGLLIALLTTLSPKTALIVDLNRLLLAGIVVNFAGWIIYEAGLAPYGYDAVMWVVVCLIMLRLLIKTRRDRRDGRSNDSLWGIVVHRHHSQN